jgi:hypothetical protein
MLVFRFEAHLYVDDHFARDLKLDAQHVGDQKTDVLCVGDQKTDVLCVGDQKTNVLGDLLLGVLRGHCVAKMNVYLMNVVMKYVTCWLLALMNENVRILELQRFHQLAFQRVA